MQNKLLAFFMVSFLTGCATERRVAPAYIPPSVSGVASPIQKTRLEVKSAVENLKKIEPHVSQEAKEDLEQLKESLVCAESASEEAQSGLIVYATQVDAQTKLLNAAITDRNAAVEKTEVWHRKAISNGKERDVVLILFSIIAAVWIGTIVAGEIMRNFPAPWSLVAAGAAYVAVAISAYWVGRFILGACAHLIP